MNMNENKNEKKNETATASASAFSKEQLLNSKKYADRRDALSVLLKDDKMYTISETDKILTEFMKGKVN